jgi:hypothetical protein
LPRRQSLSILLSWAFPELLAEAAHLLFGSSGSVDMQGRMEPGKLGFFMWWFPTMGYPNSWMVYFMRNPTYFIYG